MVASGRPFAPYHRQLLGPAPTVVVRNGFLDLEAPRGTLSRTHSSPAALGAEPHVAPRKRSPSDSDCDSGSTCSVVMSLVMQDMGPLAARDSADSRGTGGGVAPETMSSQLRAALGMSGAWFEQDADASSWASSLSPPPSSRSLAASPPWSLQTSPVLLAALPPLALPEAPPQMMLPPSSPWAPWTPSRQQPPPSQRSSPKPTPKSSPSSSPQLRPQLQVPEFAPAAIAADSAIGAEFLAAVRPMAHSIAHGVSPSTGVHRVVWTVDAEKLRNHERQAVSPSFELPLGGGLVVSRLVLFPKPAAGAKGGASFKKSRGWGSVHLKCEATAGSAVFQVSIGDGGGSFARQPRGPVLHDFADHSTCGLPKGSEYWDFGKAINRSAQTFAVCLDILPQGGP